MAGNNARAIVVQERDRHLFRELSIMRVIDREQAKTVAKFGSTTRANARLLALTNAKLLKRFFVGTLAGGKKAIYALSEKSAELVGVVARGPRRKQDQALVADFFVEHQLAINDLYCRLKYGVLPPAVSFNRWIAFHEPVASGLRLIPDGYVELTTTAGMVACFLEVDLGRESQKVWTEKTRNYLQFALSGDYERQFRQSRFRVLVLANSDRRLHSIRATVSRVTEKIFWFAPLHAIPCDGFFGPVWHRPKTNQPQPFFGEAP